MPNKNYVNGRYREYKAVKELKQAGCTIAQRTAGSHSSIDVIGINTDTREIFFIQCKPESMSEKAKAQIEELCKDLNGSFLCSFKVV